MVEEHLKNLSRTVDDVFPIRDAKGRPSYRRHQKESIMKILKAFIIDDKKFVAVDGPVGCGKSVINYTVARVIGKSIYLTPLKMLQDQIMDEKWDGVRMLKGRGSYQCNFLEDKNDRIRCNYNGDEYSMCKNSKIKDDYDKNTIDKIGKKLRSLFNNYKDNSFITRLKTAFNSVEEYESLIDEMKLFAEEKKKRFCIDFLGMNEDEIKYENELEKKIACSMDSGFECPAKSNRLLTEMAYVKVLNPDLFFTLSMQKSFDLESEMIIYDECQQIEGVINRIFKVKLPVGLIKKLFGVKFSDISTKDEISYLTKSVVDYTSNTLGPSCAATKTMYRLGSLFSVRNYSTLEKLSSETMFAKCFSGCATGFLFEKRNQKDFNISMLEIVNIAFTGRPIPGEFIVLEPFIQMVRGQFNIYCSLFGCVDKYDLYEELIPHCRTMYSEDRLNYLTTKKTKELIAKTLGDEFYENNSVDSDSVISHDRILSDHMIKLAPVLEPFVNSVMGLSNIINGDKSIFAFSKSLETGLSACGDSKLISEIAGTPDESNYFECMEIIPIDIGRLMGSFFYSKTKKVLLTSGTWVYPDGLFDLYGIPKNNVEFVKIPSTFDPDKRRVYVIDDRSFMNFSERNEQREYVYKTSEGTSRFTYDLKFIIDLLRKHIKINHKELSNIIVHCHTFDIARKIAEYMPGVDDSFLIHIGEGFRKIVNIDTNFEIENRSKDNLIQIIKENPNKGLTIISPSISEGVDFKGDIARAQIILKRPIPYLGDLYVKSHYKGNPDVGVEKDPNFLDRVCYTTIIQQYGRIVRSINDWGYTVIMDQSMPMSFKELFKKGKWKIKELNIDYLCDGIQIKGYNKGFPMFSWDFK